MTRSAGAVASTPPYWLTGTSDDMFTGIYLALSQDLTTLGKHGPVPPSEVDRMDLSTVAAFLGVGEHEAQQARAWDRARAGDPEVVMVKKSHT